MKHLQIAGYKGQLSISEMMMKRRDFYDSIGRPAAAAAAAAPQPWPAPPRFSTARRAGQARHTTK